MNRDQSIKLWLKGKDAWNKWANKLLKEKQAMIDAGEWQAETKYSSFGPLVGKNSKTINWFNRANTDFSDLWLRSIDQPEGGDKDEPEKSLGRKTIPLEQYHINFGEFIFPGNVTFHDSIFDCGEAVFRAAQFSGGDADFDEAQFSDGSADFGETQFSGGYVNFSKAQFSGGDAYFRETQFSGGNVNFSEAQFSGGYVNFSKAQFSGGNVNFSEAQFISGYAYFSEAQFSGGDAHFRQAQFSGGNVNFNEAQFSGGYADFGRAQFSGGYANFRKAQFSGGNAYFNETDFGKDAIFNLSTFEKPATFNQANFTNKADFSSITSTRSFALSGTKFHQVPDFTESSFHAPPVLDDIEVDEPVKTRSRRWCEAQGETLQEPRSRYLSNWQVANNPTDTRKYRALAKMASEAKDYQNEMKFFADEQRCRRFWHDKPIGQGAGRFWFGLLYDKLSNYGRSFLRPLIGWLAVFGFFTVVYALSATATKLTWGAALYISFRHGLIFSGLTRSDSWGSNMKILYGPTKILDIPTHISWAMAFQPLISAVFIFLFLLALRNQFKIR